MEHLVQSLLDGDRDEAITAARALLSNGVDRQQIITAGVEAAMARLDAKCTVEQFNLLEIMLCGRAAMRVIKELYPTGVPPGETKGKVVLAVLHGDIHDLGKNIVKMMLSASGYHVVDLGKNCPLETVADAVRRERPLAVGVSGLITQVIPQVQCLRDALVGCPEVSLIAGGAALRQADADELNVDFVAQSAFDGVHILDTVCAV